MKDNAYRHDIDTWTPITRV